MTPPPSPPPVPPPPSPPPPSTPPSSESLTLTALYERTGGARAAWTESTNWLVGDPCVDGWLGVWCCPQTHPVLLSWPDGGCRAEDGDADANGRRYTHQHGDDDSAGQDASSSNANATAAGDDDDAGQAAGDADGEDGAVVLRPARVFPSGCASGLATGGAADEGRCVVVAIALRSNGLDGRLDGVLDALPWLQVVLPLPLPSRHGCVCTSNLPTLSGWCDTLLTAVCPPSLAAGARAGRQRPRGPAAGLCARARRPAASARPAGASTPSSPTFGCVCPSL